MEGLRTGTIVLVAEDDPHALSGYVEFLSTAGFVAYGRGDGREALETALETVPDIVITGIAMPGLDGFGLAAALRADSITRHVPIVGMTAHWQADTRAKDTSGLQRDAAEACPPTHLLAEIERVLKQAESAAAEIRGMTEAAPSRPAGLGNAVARRRGVDY